MKELSFEKMEEINGGSWWTEHNPLGQDIGCGALGLAAGIAAGFNPVVGGLTTLGCMLIL